MGAMIRVVVLIVVGFAVGCASSKGRRSGGGSADSNKALEAARAENARLRAELVEAHKNSQTSFNDASAAQARLGTNGCAAMGGSAPGNGSQALRLQLRYGTGAAILSFMGPRNAGSARVFPCNCEVRR